MPTKKQDLRVADGIAPQTNRHYARTAAAYRGGTVLCGILLALYLLAVLVLGKDYITYDNLRYLAKDFDLTMQAGEAAAAAIPYPRQESIAFSAYRSGMAMTGGDVLRIYDAGGILLTEDTLGYDNPALCVSEKYVLAYDLGGKKYAVYNTLTSVIARETEFKLLCADVSDAGAYLLVTRSNETRYVAELYNSALRHTMSVYKDQYVLAAAIRDDGKRFVLCSAIPGETDFSCEVALYADGGAEALAVVKIDGQMPLAVDFAPDGAITVLCDSAILFLDASGNLTGQYMLTGMTLVDADMRHGVLAILGARNALGSENRLLVLDSSGDVLLDQTYRERMTAVSVAAEGQNFLCAVLSSDSILRMDSDGIAERWEQKDDDTLTICCAEYGIMVCTNDCMYYVRSSEN